MVVGSFAAPRLDGRLLEARRPGLRLGDRSLGTAAEAKVTSGRPPLGVSAAAAGCSSKVAGITAASSLSGFPAPIGFLKGSNPTG